MREGIPGANLISVFPEKYLGFVAEESLELMRICSQLVQPAPACCVQLIHLQAMAGVISFHILGMEYGPTCHKYILLLYYS